MVLGRVSSWGYGTAKAMVLKGMVLGGMALRGYSPGWGMGYGPKGVSTPWHCGKAVAPPPPLVDGQTLKIPSTFNFQACFIFVYVLDIEAAGLHRVALRSINVLLKNSILVIFERTTDRELRQMSIFNLHLSIGN